MSTETKPEGSTASRSPKKLLVEQGRRQAQRKLLLRVALSVAVFAGLLFVVSQAGDGGGGEAGASGPRFDVGSPAAGAQAPTFQLPSTAGGTFDLADQQGQTVLLYFQEGIMCQPCWDQISAIEANFADFEALGIDELVSITSDDLDLLQQKVADEGLETPVLSDPDLTLADDYSANQYGMMGTSRYGHSFVVVGPDGQIQWRADYGGDPDYTMYVEPDQLLDDLRTGLQEG